MGREHDQPGVRLLESVVDPGDDVIARPDHPLVEPCIDPALAQRRASASTAGLSFDEWLMKTRMSGPRAASITIDEPPVDVAAGPMDAASPMIRPQSAPVKPLDRTAIRFQRPDPKRAGRELGEEPLLHSSSAFLFFRNNRHI